VISKTLQVGSFETSVNAETRYPGSHGREEQPVLLLLLTSRNRVVCTTRDISFDGPNVLPHCFRIYHRIFPVCVLCCVRKGGSAIGAARLGLANKSVALLIYFF
jgi:hypothetical protein